MHFWMRGWEEPTCISPAWSGTGVCGVGAFFDEELREIIGEEATPVYMLAVGQAVQTLFN